MMMMMTKREKNGMDKKSPKREAEPEKTFRVSVRTFRVLNILSLCLKNFKISPLLSRQRSLSSFLRRFCFFFFFFFVFAGLEIIFVSALRQSDDDDDDAPLKERRQKRLNRFAERERDEEEEERRMRSGCNGG